MRVPQVPVERVGVDEYEFTLLMLLALGKVELKTIEDVVAMVKEHEVRGILR